MTITAQIIADSVSPQGIRLTTFQLRYPRFIHAEFMTHRAFSRNASSSRAVPVERLIADIERDPAMPIHWGKNQKGMQAREELDYDNREQAAGHWDDAMRDAIKHAAWLHQCGAHKQIVNRLLEPFSHINVVVTATDYANFYALRRHEDAQPEIKALADAMWQSQQHSIPAEPQPGMWHLPYTTPEDLYAVVRRLKHGRITRDEPPAWEIRDLLLKVSTARCARVSYLTHEGKESTIEEDIALYDRIIAHRPMHASPAEHQATPDEQYLMGQWHHPHQHGNLRGWRQHRKMLPNEHVPG